MHFVQMNSAQSHTKLPLVWASIWYIVGKYTTITTVTTKNELTYSELDKYDNGEQQKMKERKKGKENELDRAPSKWIQIERTKDLLNLKCISQIDVPLCSILFHLYHLYYGVCLCPRLCLCLILLTLHLAQKLAKLESLCLQNKWNFCLIRPRAIDGHTHKIQQRKTAKQTKRNEIKCKAKRICIYTFESWLLIT